MARWYSLRWRIEMYFKVLKSGFRVEACRLASAERLARYLAVMSVVAWRLFMITLIARADPNLPCSAFLAPPEFDHSTLYIARSRLFLWCECLDFCTRNRSKRPFHGARTFLLAVSPSS